MRVAFEPEDLGKGAFEDSGRDLVSLAVVAGTVRSSYQKLAAPLVGAASVAVSRRLFHVLSGTDLCYGSESSFSCG